MLLGIRCCECCCCCFCGHAATDPLLLLLMLQWAMQVLLTRVDCSNNYAAEWGSCMLGSWLGGVNITNSSFVGNLVSLAYL
jgi:hypothetical protein